MTVAKGCLSIFSYKRDILKVHLKVHISLARFSNFICKLIKSQRRKCFQVYGSFNIHFKSSINLANDVEVGGDGMFRRGIDPAKHSALENIGLY